MRALGKYVESHPRAFVLIFIMLATALIAAAALLPSPVTLEQEVTRTENGQPLDAIVYRSPTFADGSYAYRVHDRQTGDSWWLIEMDGQWVALQRTGE